MKRTYSMGIDEEGIKKYVAEGSTLQVDLLVNHANKRKPTNQTKK